MRISLRESNSVRQSKMNMLGDLSGQVLAHPCS
jgi:hypothetical protein